MTPHIQFEPSRRQQRLKRINHSSEAERKKLFAMDRLLEIQEERQPRPFLNTALGKLPPELRIMIYQHLLVKPGFQADSDHNTKNAKGSSNASQPFIHLKKSSLSILRTCRQINHEAHGILLTGGIPYFANAWELLCYLTGIGSTGRLRLEAFRIGALVCPDPSEDQGRPQQSGVYFFGEEGVMSCRYATKDPDMTGAFSLLMECRSLHTIYMDMKQGEEYTNFFMLRTFMTGAHKDLHFQELHDWFVHRLEDPKPYASGECHLRPTSLYRTLISSGKPMGCDVLVKVRMNPLSVPNPLSSFCHE